MDSQLVNTELDAARNLATIGLITALVGLFPIALAAGFSAMRRLRATSEPDDGSKAFATAAIVIGLLQLAVFCFWIIRFNFLA